MRPGSSSCESIPGVARVHTRSSSIAMPPMGVRTPSQMKAVPMNTLPSLARLENPLGNAPSLKTEHPFRIAMEHLLHDVRRITEFAPFPHQASIGETGIVAAENNLVSQASTNINFQLSRKMFRSPPRKFPEHVAFVQSDRSHLLDPRPTGMRCNDRQTRKIGRKLVDG